MAEPLFALGGVMSAGVLGSEEVEGVPLSLPRPVKAFFKRPNTLCLFLWAGPVRGSAIVKRGDRFVMSGRGIS
jgi:hypothetical protein